MFTDEAMASADAGQLPPRSQRTLNSPTVAALSMASLELESEPLTGMSTTDMRVGMCVCVAAWSLLRNAAASTHGSMQRAFRSVDKDGYVAGDVHTESESSYTLVVFVSGGADDYDEDEEVRGCPTREHVQLTRILHDSQVRPDREGGAASPDRDAPQVCLHPPSGI